MTSFYLRDYLLYGISVITMVIGMVTNNYFWFIPVLIIAPIHILIVKGENYEGE